MASMVSRSGSSTSSNRAQADPPPNLVASVETRGVNRVKDDFLACISHELRTPLTAILGMAALLQESAVGDLTDRQRHYTQVIHRSGQHLMGIVNDILDLTRLESGQITLNYQPIEIAPICQEAFEQAQRLTGVQSASSPPFCPRFHLTIEPGLDHLVADGDRLRQMLAHLLSNALKFTDESSGAMGLKVGQWEGWIAFTVWDRGIGIPNDKQHLLFQRFQQLEPPLTRQFEGTGLGLVLTQRLAHLHGGDVTFTSQEHQGSQFTLLLPPQPPPGDDGPQPCPQPESAQSVGPLGGGEFTGPRRWGGAFDGPGLPGDDRPHGPRSPGKGPHPQSLSDFAQSPTAPAVGLGCATATQGRSGHQSPADRHDLAAGGEPSDG
ncbi:MAG: HAMP domain-containing histidine kinase [Alkalinema sp. RU_4_3]|nr:HAMP domain-containing histidine kinase [Alkalinema sp. RU_4_3]